MPDDLRPASGEQVEVRLRALDRSNPPKSAIALLRAYWSDEKIDLRAKHYGLSVDDYKRSNLLGVEIRADEVAAIITALLGPMFRATTGAQIPIDGGNNRVVEQIRVRTHAGTQLLQGRNAFALAG